MIEGAGNRRCMPLRWGLVLVATLLAGCAQFQPPSPIESRKVGVAGQAPKELPAAPAGFYRVKRGDTLVGIALEHGVGWRELAQWNQIANPNLIDVGQMLRVREPKPEMTAQ